jgi:hypothetical protein
MLTSCVDDDHDDDDDMIMMMMMMTLYDDDDDKKEEKNNVQDIFTLGLLDLSSLKKLTTSSGNKAVASIQGARRQISRLGFQTIIILGYFPTPGRRLHATRRATITASTSEKMPVVEQEICFLKNCCRVVVAPKILLMKSQQAVWRSFLDRRFLSNRQYRASIILCILSPTSPTH